MILPPLGAAWRFDGYCVVKRSGAPPVAPPDALAPGEPSAAPLEVAAGWLAPGAVEVDGAAPWHAANTNIALAKTPARRFCMNGPPSCVSPHRCRADVDAGNPFAEPSSTQGWISKVETGMRGHQ